MATKLQKVLAVLIVLGTIEYFSNQAWKPFYLLLQLSSENVLKFLLKKVEMS